MSSAQREIQQIDDGSLETEAALEPFALKQQVAEKIAAHRARRGRPAGPQLAPHQLPPARERSARIAATVAERYAHSQSYRAFLAEEAEKAIRQAEAAAEIAQRNADAVAAAQYELLAELDQYASEAPSAVPVPVPPQPLQDLPDLLIASPSPAHPIAEGTINAAATLKVRLYEEAALKSPQLPPTPAAPHVSDEVDEAETMALDEEIAFRQAPVFEETTPPVEIPANLIEFPRQLVASRRARPRLAEGPLREDADRSAESSQLRIFEVEAAEISSTPAVESAAPEWSSILLSPQPAPTMIQLTDEEPFVPTVKVPQTAAISLRLMAAIVDGVIVTASMLIFVAVFVLTASHFAPPGALRMSPQGALIAAAGTLAVFGLIYQLLFFTFSESTPGMRYARIALCTFSDDNPTRAAMRHRIFAHLLSACPLGIGYLWAMLDDDRLGWHDRITRMYQRSY